MSKRLLILALASASILPSCTEEPRNTEPLTDPWLRERTPVNIRLESQIGAAVITDDWTDDTVGSVTVSLITTGLDLSKVKVEAVDFKYPDSEFCPKASIGPGSTLDLSSGKTSFTVTAYNGETRTYSLEYSKFRDSLEGTYSFTKVAGILDEKNAPKCSFIVVGGWDGEVVRSTIMDKWWHWDTGYMPTDEDDNILSFRLEKADAETGETYEALASDDPADLKIMDNSVELRVEEHIAAINAFLSILCLQLGFSAGTFTFDQHAGIKTATEVISENSKTYKTIKTIQNQLAPAIEHLVHNIVDVAALYDMEFDGQKVAALASGGYHVQIAFDDGVTQDRQTNINEGVMLVGAGLLSKLSFMTDKKYGMGLTPEQAAAELKQIKAEGTGNSVDVTKLFGGME